LSAVNERGLSIAYISNFADKGKVAFFNCDGQIAQLFVAKKLKSFFKDYGVSVLTRRGAIKVLWTFCKQGEGVNSNFVQISFMYSP